MAEPPPLTSSSSSPPPPSSSSTETSTHFLGISRDSFVDTVLTSRSSPPSFLRLQPLPVSPPSFWSVFPTSSMEDNRFEEHLFQGLSSAIEFSRYESIAGMPPAQPSLFFPDHVVAESPTWQIAETLLPKQSILTPALDISGLSDIDLGFESAFPSFRRCPQESVANSDHAFGPSNPNSPYPLHRSDHLMHESLPSSFPVHEEQEKPSCSGSSPSRATGLIIPSSAHGAAEGTSAGEAPGSPNSFMTTSSSEHLEEDSGRGDAVTLAADTTGYEPEEEKALPEEEDHQKNSIEANKKPIQPRKKGQKRVRNPRIALVTKSDVDHLEDGYRWRKYGQKAVKNSPHPRSYYRCTNGKCSVKKRVERCCEDPSLVVTTYEGQHTHHSPAALRGTPETLPLSFADQSFLANCLINMNNQPASRNIINPFQGLHPPIISPLQFSNSSTFNLPRHLNFTPSSILHTSTIAPPRQPSTSPALIQPPVDEGLLDDMFPSAIRKSSS